MFEQISPALASQLAASKAAAAQAAQSAQAVSAQKANPVAVRKSVLRGAKVASFSSVLTALPEGQFSSGLTSEGLEEAIERIKEQAYHDGFGEGRENGYLVGVSAGKRDGYSDGQVIGLEETRIAREQEMAHLLGEFQQLRDDFQQAVDEWFVQSEQAMAELAMDIARKVLETELNTSRESVLAIVHNTLLQITSASNARVRLNPHDVTYFKDHAELLSRLGTGLRNVEFINDPSISAGAIVETDGGIIDSSIETKLVLIENELDQAA